MSEHILDTRPIRDGAAFYGCRAKQYERTTQAKEETMSAKPGGYTRFMLEMVGSAIAASSYMWLVIGPLAAADMGMHWFTGGLLGISGFLAANAIGLPLLFMAWRMRGQP